MFVNSAFVKCGRKVVYKVLLLLLLLCEMEAKRRGKAKTRDKKLNL
jgi:hypothetical protein